MALAGVSLALLFGCSRVEAQPPYAEWAARWGEARLRAHEGPRNLAVWAEIDSIESALVDSLSLALGEGPLPSFGADSASTGWLRARLDEALLLGDPRFDRLFGPNWTPDQVESLDPGGRFALPTALFLLERNRPAEALPWIDRYRATTAGSTDTEVARALELDAALAAGDTLAAAARAERILAEAGVGEKSDWAMRARETLVWGAVLAGRLEEAERRVAQWEPVSEQSLFVLRARRRIAQVRGEQVRSDELRLAIAREYPASREARGLLEARARTGFSELSRAERQLLFTVAEATIDVPRLLALDAALAPELNDPERRALALRGARLLYKAKQYSLLRAQFAGPWREAPRPDGDWSLLVARTYRNAGAPDTMATWFETAAEVSSAEDRATALWEWAREHEYLRDFGTADTLYGRFLDAGPGKKRNDALIRRGLCRLLLGRTDAARRAFALVAEGEGAADRAAGRFWLYRVALAEGNIELARSELRQAAAQSGGYYAHRARTALAFAAEGISIADPEGYWAAVRGLIERPEIEQANLVASMARAGALAAGARDTSLSASDEARLRERAERLLLFRRHDRAEWADAARRRLEGSSALGEEAIRVRRLFALGFPDLAVRSAFRLSGGEASLRHPTPYAGAVADAARQRSIAPELLWAIMRRESVFESSVRSHAGAVGLMQFMPTTAEQTAARRGIPAAPLRSPRVNLGLGAAHLRDLADDEPGPVPILIAAYNAGIENARRWYSVAEDPDLYIERIGYRETREYVMLVLEAYWIYRDLLRVQAP
ncbi:MAG: lytic transglycosylase domain-containing protein [Candidatus Eisenbacteria bacterium]|nr:lytic transglycosylase domain-containing protein [Candidatus Eisenbacteria bacterium]